MTPVGFVENGYQFMGGDDTDQKNWKKLDPNSFTASLGNITHYTPQPGGQQYQRQAAPSMMGNTADNLSRNLLQGLTFGYGDEMEAGAYAAEDWLRGKGSFNDAYNRNLADVRGSMGQWNEVNPKTALAAEALGGVGQALMLPGAGGGWMPRLAQAAGEGALYASGKATENRGQAALMGGAMGGALGGATQAVGAGIQAAPEFLRKGAVKNVMNLLSPTKKTHMYVKEVAPTLANELPVKWTRSGLENYLENRQQQLGQQLSSGYASKGNVAPRDVYDLFGKVGDQRYSPNIGARVPASPDAILNQPVENLVNQMQDDLLNLTNKAGEVPASALWQNKSRLYRKQTEPNTGTLKLTSPGTVSAVEQATAGAYRDKLNQLFPDLAPLNNSYSAVARAGKVNEDLALARAANESYTSRGGTHGFGGVVKSLVPSALVGAGLGYMQDGWSGAALGGAGTAAMRYLGSTPHNTGAARVKMKGANVVEKYNKAVSRKIQEDAMRRALLPFMLLREE